MRKEVEELVLAIDAALMSKNPILGDAIDALNQLSAKYERDVDRVVGQMLYKDIRAERTKQLNVPYSVLSRLD